MAGTPSREISSQARLPIYGLVVACHMATTEAEAVPAGRVKTCPATLLTERIPSAPYDSVPQAIPAEIGACASLAELYINNNQKVNTPCMRSLPHIISRMYNGMQPTILRGPGSTRAQSVSMLNSSHYYHATDFSNKPLFCSVQAVCEREVNARVLRYVRSLARPTHMMVDAPTAQEYTA